MRDELASPRNTALEKVVSNFVVDEPIPPHSAADPCASSNLAVVSRPCFACVLHVAPEEQEPGVVQGPAVEVVCVLVDDCEAEAAIPSRNVDVDAAAALALECTRVLGLGFRVSGLGFRVLGY